MRAALRSVLIQAVGSVATVLVSVLISATLGLAAQGQFGLLRTWNDALVSLAVLGLPQGLLQLQYRRGVAPQALHRWAWGHVFKVAILLAGGLLVLWCLYPNAPPWGGWPWWVWAVVAAGVPLSSLHLLWRALLLRHVSAVRYAWITAAPALWLLGGISVVCGWGASGDLVWGLFFSALLGWVGCGWVFARMLNSQPSAALLRWSRRQLWSIGLENGLQNTLTALAPALLLSSLRYFEAPLTEVGSVSLGLHVYQIFAIGANYLGPLVYDRWSRQATPPSTRQLWLQIKRRASPRRLGLLGTMSTVGLVVVVWAVPDVSWRWALLLMASAGALALVVRLLTTLMLSRAVLRPLSYQAVWRCVAMVMGAALLMPLCGAVLAASLIMALTELTLLVWLLCL